MRKYWRLVLFVMLFTLPLYGQWVPLNSGTSADLRAIDFADDDFGVAVGEYGTILFTENGGDLWTDVSVPDQKETLRSLLIIGRDNILTAGYSPFDGIVRRTTNIAAQTWDSVAAGGDLALAQGEILALRYDLLQYSRDQGVTWSAYPFRFGSTLLMDRLRFADGNTGYIIGNVSGFASYSTYGFRSNEWSETGGWDWRPLWIFDLPNANAYTTFSTPSPDTAYLFTNKLINFSPGPENTLVRMTGFYFDADPNRNAWRFQAEEVNANLPAYMTCSAFVDGLIGYAGSIDGRIYATKNGGVDWTPEYSGRDTIFLILITENRFVYAVGSNGLILRRPLSNPTSALDTPSPFEVFPNPTANSLHMKGLLLEKAQGRLLSYTGKLIRIFNWRQGQQIDVSDLEAGGYLLEFRTGSSRYLAKFQKLP